MPQETVDVRNPDGLAVRFDVVLQLTHGSNERMHRTPAVWRPEAAQSGSPRRGVGRPLLAASALRPM